MVLILDVYLGGGFVRDHRGTCRSLDYNVEERPSFGICLMEERFGFVS